MGESVQRTPRRKVMQTPDEVAAMLRLKSLGWGVRRIARGLVCSPITVRRWISEGGWVPYRGRGRPRARTRRLLPQRVAFAGQRRKTGGRGLRLCDRSRRRGMGLWLARRDLRRHQNLGESPADHAEGGGGFRQIDDAALAIRITVVDDDVDRAAVYEIDDPRQCRKRKPEMDRRKFLVIETRPARRQPSGEKSSIPRGDAGLLDAPIGLGRDGSLGRWRGIRPRARFAMGDKDRRN
jgi:hypothetical protein